ncbi:DEAD/DEAH box helicase [Chromobacterium subtsugae]|uniref:DEAD/DEAH box helicase n=1 Tax=Chromobacterium subtsugae TaxID=251747 RepID=UPI0006414C74|nr:type ISP restriction/modification enzyme [Chromobacterium subtsugae]
MSALQNLLASFRNAAVTEREKGTYFEELIICYLKNEATYRDLYSDVWTFAEWVEQYGHGWNKKDTGIDLVARTTEGEYHAIQCKFYAEDYKVQKSDIDSFFTASGKQPFSRRLIVTTTNNWGPNAEDALIGQQPPVTKLDLQALEDSQIDWSQYASKQAVVLKPKKQLRDHQIRALARVEVGLATADRGKLIMACGTGKTFTSLKIAEKLVGAGKRVLFLVPSLSLLSQTLTEWTQESDTPLHSFAVCSDSDVGKRRKKDDDVVQTLAHELRYPATTDAARLATEMAKRHDNEHMSVVFSTYHSIDVISRAQLEHGLADFDLIICDEAHRTTGATFDGEEESAFVRVHDGAYIRAAKRLYMTATPRIYGDSAKVTAEKGDVTLCSMDDETLFGKELFVITFSEAVKAGLLVDYKVLVLAMDEAHISRSLQNLLKDDDNQIKVEDAAKIVGCWKALSKQDTREDLGDDAAAMRRAVAFCQVIEYQSNAKTHKISSKKIADMFSAVVEEYKASNPDEDCATLMCEADHVDGGMNAGEKESKLAWLKSPVPEDTCRILSNVRCLSEGVDVPALDAVLFLTPRSSQVDVVQSVGRVMRLAEGKKRGYVILPVVIPAGMAPDEALNDNKTYKVVWQVLQALRSHDDRFDAMINKLDLVGNDTSKMEVIAVTEKVQKKADKNAAAASLSKGKGTYGIGSIAKVEDGQNNPVQQTLEFEIGEIERAIFAKVVQKCGNRHHWEDWANDIAKIARTHITRITEIVNNDSNHDEQVAFEGLVAELRDDLNDSITREEVIEMLAQHLITKPVFDALFADYSFASHNPMSKAMQNVLDRLHEHRLDKEADTLEKFYASVKLRAEGIDKAEGKQKIIVELYDKFFANAFPRLRDKLGIVYTPVEVVDFIIHSVEHILQTEFGQSLASDGVHIIDPFTGTGTFITRLMQSGIFSPEQLKKKYKGQIHANEIVLLAYYIAAINIEAVYHGIVGSDYVPFDGICLTDTFQMYEKEDLVDQVLFQNSARRKRQKALDIRVIIGNPPYSAGQDSANDNNQNVAYPSLDARIRDSYAARSKATLKNALYDSYIRAIRWASDRLGDSGVIGFVTNAGFLEANTADGLRKCLADEFSNIYVFHLRGNQRTSGELSRREGGKIFGSGSRAPIAISLLVKKPQAAAHGQIYWHDIGDSLSREQKLEIINGFGSVAGIAEVDGWQAIIPDEHGDWVRQRDDSFNDFITVGCKADGSVTAIFENYTGGVKTNRDAWCYNNSKSKLSENVQNMLDFYNFERRRFNNEFSDLTNTKDRSAEVDGFVSADSEKISWSVNLKNELAKNRDISFEYNGLVRSLYRPYGKQWLYFNRLLNERVLQIPKIFPNGVADNLIICTSGIGAKNFSVLISDMPPCFDNLEKGQCFPLYLYDDEDAKFARSTPSQHGLFDSQAAASAELGRTRRDAITDEGLAHFVTAYPGEQINKEDIFYYVYGLLHSPDYRERFADNLSKELPRIPCVKGAANFWNFSKAGREMAELHLNYETVPMYEGVKVDTGGKTLTAADYRVEQMKYGKKGKDKDLTTLHYNSRITVTSIPLEAYEYVVNGKPALNWVVERQCVKRDKDSGIVNDANDWAIETMNNPRYPLELFLRVITVSLETMKIVKALPPLDL